MLVAVTRGNGEQVMYWVFICKVITPMFVICMHNRRTITINNIAIVDCVFRSVFACVFGITVICAYFALTVEHKKFVVVNRQDAYVLPGVPTVIA